MKKKYWLLVLLAYAVYFFFPNEVNAQTHYVDATPISANVWIQSNNMSPTTQPIHQESYYNRVYFGFTYGSTAYNEGVTWNYAEISSLNNQHILDINFGIYSPQMRTNSFQIFDQVFLKDSYENSISCYIDPNNNIKNIGENNQQNYAYGGISYICNSGHLSGPFTITATGGYTHTNTFIGITEISFSYDDGTSSSSADIGSIKNNTKETNDLIKNDNVDGANSQGSSFFSNFSSDTHGLSGIVSSPIRLINSLSSSTCSPLTFTIPFVNSQVALPCMSSIYSTYFPSLLSVYQLITTGLIAYKILINLFGVVKGLQDPDSSRIEVVDL